jgi:hypothetical protein
MAITLLLKIIICPESISKVEFLSGRPMIWQFSAFLSVTGESGSVPPHPAEMA